MHAYYNDGNDIIHATPHYNNIIIRWFQIHSECHSINFQVYTSAAR